MKKNLEEANNEWNFLLKTPLSVCFVTYDEGTIEALSIIVFPCLVC